ncbi:MAG: signal recognition particle-docking protein FtsY [Mycoplasmatales bacterium]|nr:signal recognition particle-docking protein FtsY [Mycoplasmatales bacterium]
MGFFKKLKERLFTLKVDEKKEQKNKISKENKKTSKVSDSRPSSVKAKEIKLEKKIEKEKLKRRKKEKKIDKYVAGLEKSGSSFSQRIKEIQSKHNEIDEDFFEELEEILIMSDISVELVVDIIDAIKREVKIENVSDPKLIAEIIADKMFTVYANKSVVDTTLNYEDKRLNIFLMVGVNGAGKTTTIAKIANSYIKEGKKVLIAAGDTFRAGAVEQLAVWADRVGCDIVKPVKSSADPASVVFDALLKAKENNYDLLIIDTAGRLQNKVNLMKELEKINKIIQREIPEAPHESLLVLDATTGQNGVSQAISFKEVTPLSGIVLTKMDGTSKGGIVLTIKEKLELSVKLLGLGEGLDDLQEFDLDAFIYGMTKGLMDESR